MNRLHSWSGLYWTSWLTSQRLIQRCCEIAGTLNLIGRYLGPLNISYLIGHREDLHGLSSSRMHNIHAKKRLYLLSVLQLNITWNTWKGSGRRFIKIQIAESPDIKNLKMRISIKHQNRWNPDKAKRSRRAVRSLKLRSVKLSPFALAKLSID